MWFSIKIKGEYPLGFDTYYWDGEGFTDNEEEAMLYQTNKDIEFVKNNLFTTKLGKKILKAAGEYKDRIEIDNF